MNTFPKRCAQGAAEDGQVGVLIIGYVLLTLLLVSVMAAASALYIEHKKLLSLADGAALAAADSFAVGTATADDDGAADPPAPLLTSAGVRGSVQRYLADVDASTRFEALAIEPETGAPDSRTAQASLSCVLRPPMLSILLPAGIPVAAVADARTILIR